VRFLKKNFILRALTCSQIWLGFLVNEGQPTYLKIKFIKKEEGKKKKKKKIHQKKEIRKKKKKKNYYKN